MTRQERNTYVEDNLGLVHYWLRKYRALPNYEDIFQQGLLGMIQALDRMGEDDINVGYIKRYVTGFVITYMNKLESMVYRINPGKGTYERLECNSLDMRVGSEDDNITYGELLIDEYDSYQDVITKVDFESYVKGSNVKYKDEMMLFLKGYDRKDIAQEMGISYEALRQQLKRLNKAAFV